MAASKVTEICEEFPEIHTYYPQVNRASSWSSYPTAGNVALGKVGILLMHIPKKRPNPKVNRAGRWPPYPPVGCPPDCQLWVSPTFCALLHPEIVRSIHLDLDCSLLLVDFTPCPTPLTNALGSTHVDLFDPQPGSVVKIDLMNAGWR
jgi:hypothetical protein